MEQILHKWVIYDAFHIFPYSTAILSAQHLDPGDHCNAKATWHDACAEGPETAHGGGQNPWGS